MDIVPTIITQAVALAISSEIFSTALRITAAIAAVIVILPWALVAEVQAVAQGAPVHQEVAEARRLQEDFNQVSAKH